MRSPIDALTDLCDRDDVESLVRAVYGRALADPLLGPVFVDVARMDLDAHLPVMCDFWETVLFRAGTYRRNAFTVHVDLHRRAVLTAGHFQRWLTLWTQTVDVLYAGPVASHAKVQASRIAESIHRRLQSTSDTQPLSIGATPVRDRDVCVFRAGEDTGPDGSQQPRRAGSTDHDHRMASIRERKGQPR
ncbi:MAG: group III truncated hemoglobin [Jatrophihabitantaceae bacterium]